MPKYTDYKKVRQLGKDILLEDKKMLSLTGTLEKELKVLKTSFQDDGIDDVELYVKRLITKLKMAQNAFQTISYELIEYSKLLESGKR